MEALGRDVRYGLRLLLRTPVFSLFAVVSLAPGIGAAVAVFALFDAIMLRKLPVPEPDRLVVASFGRPGADYNYALPYPQFERIRQGTSTLDGVFAMSSMGRVSVSVAGNAQVAEGLLVSGDYYSTLRLSPALGRLLGPDDDHEARAVAVISHAYWQRRFGGSPEALEATVALNGVPVAIVGVEPPGFLGAEVGSHTTSPCRCACSTGSKRGRHGTSLLRPGFE